VSGLIATPEDLGRGIACLGELEPRFAVVHKAIGDPPLRREPPGFAALMRMIVYQHVSLASAGAVWRRLEDELGAVTVEAVAARAQQDLRDFGLTNAKARSCLAIAEAVAEGRADLDGLVHLPDDAARAALVALPGIGPWTAELYLLTCLGRTDAWPGGDVALRSAARDVFTLAQRPDTHDMEILAEPWRPWRAVAARLLWAYYRHAGVGG
jgi:DNA-3-methyladenine glycosylase II